jgi:predicted nuclease with TOPRIM domain
MCTEEHQKSASEIEGAGAIKEAPPSTQHVRELAELRERVGRYESRDRAKLEKMQEDVLQGVKDLKDEHPNYPELESLVPWGQEFTKTSSIDGVLPMARAVQCFSMDKKRLRDIAAQNANIIKENEELKAEVSSKSARITELETHNLELQNNYNVLDKHMADKFNSVEKLNFSKASSREVSSASDSSKTAHVVQDALLAYVSNNGSGGSRMAPSGSSHHFLGSSNGGDAMSISSAINRAIAIG